MAYEFIDMCDQLDPSKYHLKCPYAMIPERIVIHNTANDATAVNEVRYMHRNDKPTSFHFAIDHINATQGIPLNRNAFHAGDGAFGKGNREGIGIEICYSESGGKLFEESQSNTAHFCALLMHELGWGFDPTRITKHEDYADKHCPHRTLDEYGWDYFLNLVHLYYYILYPEEVEMPEEIKELYDELATLSARVEELSAELDRYDTGQVYNNTAIKWAYNDGNIPKWAKPTVNKLCSKGILKGADNNLELSRLMLRILVMLDRAGVFG